MCISTSNRRRFSVSESGKTARFQNPDRSDIDVGDVDGCLINDARERCDYFVRNANTIWLIELKGNKVGKAISQIVASTHYLDAEIGDKCVVPVIVTSKSPAIADKQKELLKL